MAGKRRKKRCQNRTLAAKRKLSRGIKEITSVRINRATGKVMLRKIGHHHEYADCGK